MAEKIEQNEHIFEAIALFTNIFGKYSRLSWDRTNFASLFWS